MAALQQRVKNLEKSLAQALQSNQDKANMPQRPIVGLKTLMNSSPGETQESVRFSK